MPTIIDLRPEIEKVSGRIAIVALSCEDFFKMKQLVQNDTKLQAVKHVKESAKCGLKEAKNFVDTYRDYVLND